MKESRFGFEYTWSDLRPIRALSVTMLVAQILGAAVGMAVPRFPQWFESMWFGAAVCTLPAFAIGLVIQAHAKPGSLSQNKVMVRRVGQISAGLTTFALAMPLLGFGRTG